MLFKFIIILVVTAEFTLSANSKKDNKSKSVTTLINARWDATPLALEALEYLADENPYFFWTFVDSVCSDKPLSELSTDKERYDVIIDKARGMLTEAEVSLLKLGLSLHIYSPKVEMYSQIALDRGLPQECSAVVDINGKLSCDLSEIEDILKQQNSGEKSELFNIDHHYPDSENNSIIAILYGELGTAEFSKFHKVLKNKAADGLVNYVVRHHIKQRSSRKLRLSGYGVELQMKSTEYKSQDDSPQPVDGEDSTIESDSEEDDEIEGFNFKQLRSLFPELSQNLTKFKQHLSETNGELAPLKAWQFQDLGLQAAERALSAPPEEALAIMTYTSQNFPMQAKSLLRNNVPMALKTEMKQNSEMFLAALNLQPSDTALFINGLFCDLDSTDIFALVDIMRSELRSMEGLHRIGITSSITSLLSLELSPNSGSQQNFALDIRDSAVLWINDLEQDKHYSRWSSSLMEMLRPTFPGMLRSVRKNLFNLILLIDPADSSSKPLLKLAESFIVHKAPLRVGLVFSIPPTENDENSSGLSLLCAFNYVMETKDAREAMGFLTDVYARVLEDEVITSADVRMELKKKFPKADLDDILGEESSYDFGRQLSKDFILRSGMRTMPQALLNGVPLPSAQLNADEFEEAVLTEIMHQTPTIQKAIYKGELQDSDNVVDFLMSKPNVMPRLNHRILNTEDSTYLDMTGISLKDITNLQLLLQLNTRDMTATLMKHIKYFSPIKPKSKDPVYYTTYWVIADLKNELSRNLLLSSLQYMKSSGTIRLAFIPNTNNERGDDNTINKLVLAALETMTPAKATEYTIKLLQKTEDDIKNKNYEVPAILNSALPEQENNLKILRVYSQRALNFPASARGLVCDGRLIGPLSMDEDIQAEDLSLLERFSASMYGDKLKEALKRGEEYEDEKLTSDMVMQIVSLLVSRPQGKNRFQMPKVKEDHSVIKIPAKDKDQPALQLWAVVDPVSRGAQKLGPILITMQKVLNCDIKIYLNAVDKHSDMPLKSFYRFVLDPELQFNSNGRLTGGPMAKFTHMPASPLLTQNIQVPDNWLVESVKAVYDLDNIRLQDVETVVHSEYELEYLLLEGHCFDSMGAPPRGLQVTLGTRQKPLLMDTIVMANLGYFQLKANPGAWLLNLREGRSRDMYDITSYDGIEVPNNSTDIKILLSSFQANVVKLRVAKKPDMFHLDLLGDDEPQAGLWNSITSSFSGTNNEEDETLNIFSLASGHLYERFLRIMMLSVLKNTKTPVKFWFLKNYLSPALKDFLPFMSKEYGFEYELVQYKWPRWLHQQTEKQRIIWGYKILFLDVLFPLGVKKIIFVDADQIVRADMIELRNLDLGGAPYGYTPFCESRTEMDGFRFWKHGYWRNHLQGRRYHISALYVVDLKRFRRIAAGDRLRGQYQALSQDPNSLANLDQDLPNNMIHQVAIKSLPQEWLWCETWCDDDSKSKAKTIDLCNNPQTKEAKLSAAVRIVPEWTDYDNEMKTLQQKIDSGYFTDHEEQEENVIFDDHILPDVHNEL